MRQRCRESLPGWGYVDSTPWLRKGKWLSSWDIPRTPLAEAEEGLKGLKGFNQESASVSAAF